MAAIPLRPGTVDVVLRDPARGEIVGRWHFSQGGECLHIDVLAGRSMCRVDGRDADVVEYDDAFIPWPRLRFEVNGEIVEVVSRDPEVLRRHYGRPHHQEESYKPVPDPYVDAFHQARIAQVRRLLRGVRGRVLDVGSGYSIVAMAGPWPFLVDACDRDHQAIVKMRELGMARGVVSSAETLPYRDASFDAVFAGEIVEHLLDPGAALREWLRVLRPGGRLVLTTPNRRHLMARLTGREEVCNPEHLFEFSRAELIAAIERAGGRVRRVEGLHLAVPVWVPTRGWRDLLAVVQRRWHLPLSVYRRAVAAGRFFPSLASNLAVVAERPARELSSSLPPRTRDTVAAPR